MARLYSLATIIALAVGTPNAFPQSGKDTAPDSAADELDRMRRLLEKHTQTPQTEREKFLKELRKLAPEMTLGDDPDGWFDLLAGGGKVWDRTTIAKKDLSEIFGRVASRLNLSGDEVTRTEFRAYARQYLSPDRSPPWKEPKDPDWAGEAGKVFRRLDRDGDGKLAGAEVPQALGSDLRRWDADSNGSVSPTEYGAYFPERYRQVVRELSNERPGADRPLPRAVPLPPGLPAWFAQLDTDRDGQIGLYEWRRVWPAKEFAQADPNQDGFLTADELRRLLEATGPSRLPLADDLARRQVRSPGK